MALIHNVLDRDRAALVLVSDVQRLACSQQRDNKKVTKFYYSIRCSLGAQIPFRTLSARILTVCLENTCEERSSLIPRASLELLPHPLVLSYSLRYITFQDWIATK